MTARRDCAQDALRKCAAGTLSANMALMQLFLHAPDIAAARQSLEKATGQSENEGRERLLGLAALWSESPDAFELVKAVIEADDATEQSGAQDRIGGWTEAFDRSATLSPAASVALYSLGREDILSETTAEVASYLRRQNLLGRDRSALEIGCGIGRFLAALAPELSRMVGLDVSPVMLAEARRRCASCRNVECLLGNGRDFPDLPSESFDLALAIDSFPYLVSAGEEVARSNMEEAHRVLRPKGRLLIINYSYRGDELDRGDAIDIAAAVGFDIRCCGTRPFRLWDGAVFDFERSG